MNRFERGGSGEARVRYFDHDFQVTMTGGYVVCAVTGKHIPLDELMYWSVARQEPYIDAASSLERELAVNPELRKRG
ncbi:MAG: DUF2093 domain-containing protein [Rhizobiaceae bacterium]